MIGDLESCNVMGDGLCTTHNQDGRLCRKQAVDEWDRLRLELEEKKLQIETLKRQATWSENSKLRAELEEKKLQIDEQKRDKERIRLERDSTEHNFCRAVERAEVAERLLSEAKALLQRFLDAGPEEEYQVILCKLSRDVEKFLAPAVKKEISSTNDESCACGKCWYCEHRC